MSEVATAFFEQVLAHANAQHLLSDENFTVNGTLIEAWAGQKWFKKKRAESSDSPTDHPSNARVDFRGEQRTTATHTSIPDSDARL